MALVVGLNLVGELVLDCGEIIVGEAGDIAWKAGELRAFDDLQPNGAGDVKPARRRAIEKPRVEREFNGLAGSDDRLRRMEGEIEPLRNIILEHELDPADAVALGIGVSLDRPFARRRTWQQRYGVSAPAEALVGQGRASVFDAVRPLDDKRQRQAGFRHALGVAQKRGGEHGLARAIDAALGVEERVEPSGRIAAGDAAITKVEGVLSEAEEAVVAGERGDQKSRRRAATPTRESRIEIDPAVCAGRFRRQHFVVARDEPQLHACERPGGAKRLHQRMHAVVAGNRGQAEIGDHHPLRRELHTLLGIRIGGVRRAFPRPRGDDIDSGLELADRLKHRKVSHDVLVELRRRRPSSRSRLSRRPARRSRPRATNRWASGNRRD